MRYLLRGNLLLPVRPLHGPAPHDVVWRPADSARVINILKNPAYAGAYVYGRRRPDPLRRQPGSDRIGTTAVVPEIDDVNSLAWPAEHGGSLDQPILQFRAFLMMTDLPGG